MSAAYTPAQARYLAAIVAAGAKGKRYNGRARRALQTLERMGVILVDWDMFPATSGTMAWDITAWAVDDKLVWITANGPAGLHGPVGGFDIRCSDGWTATGLARRYDAVRVAYHHLFGQALS